MNKKHTKFIARLLCLVIAVAMLSVPVVSEASGSDMLVHATEGLVFTTLSAVCGDKPYDTSNVESIDGLAYRVIAVNSDINNYSTKTVVRNIYNKSGTEYFTGFTNTTDASDIVVAIENKTPSGMSIQETVILTVEGKYATLPTEKTILLDSSNTDPLFDGTGIITASDEEIVNKYLTRMLYGTLTNDDQVVADDKVFDYLIHKWCDATNNDAIYNVYKVNQNVQGCSTYFAIEFYYIHGSHEVSTINGKNRCIVGSAVSLSKAAGVSDDAIWKNKYSSSESYKNTLLSKWNPTISADDRIMRLYDGAFTIPKISMRGNLTGSLFTSGTTDFYGRALFVPRTNSGEYGANVTTKPLGEDKLKLKVTRLLDQEYYSEVGYAYNNLNITIDNSSTGINELKNIVQSSAYSNLSSDEQNNIKNIKLTIKISRSGVYDNEDGFVSGWSIGGKYGDGLLKDHSLYPLKGDRYALSDTELANSVDSFVVIDDTVYFNSRNNQRIHPGKFSVGSMASCDAGVTTVENIPNSSSDPGTLLGSTAQGFRNGIVWLNDAYKDTVEHSQIYLWKSTDLKACDFANIARVFGDNYEVIAHFVYSSTSVYDGHENYKVISSIVRNKNTGNFYLVRNTAGAYAHMEGDTVYDVLTYSYGTYTSGGIDWLDYSKFNAEDPDRTNSGLAIINDSGTRAQSRLDFDYVNNDSPKKTVYTAELYMSVQEFMDYINSGGIACCIQSKRNMTYVVEASIDIINKESVFNTSLYPNCTMNLEKAVVSTADPTVVETVTKWRLASPSKPTVYAEIKANNVNNEDWDVMSGVPTTENLWVGVGADQYRYTISGAIFTIGSPKKLNGTATGISTPEWHISGSVPFGYNYGLSSKTLPATRGNYDNQFHQMLAQDVGSTVNRYGEISAGYSNEEMTMLTTGTPESNAAIYRVVRLCIGLHGYWGATNKPNKLHCDGHNILTLSESACGEVDKDHTSPGACSVCGANHSHSVNKELQDATCHPTGSGHTDDCYKYTCSFSGCSSTLDFNCSSGVLTPGGDVPPSGFTTSPQNPNEETYFQSKWIEAGECIVGSKKQSYSEVKDTSLIDDGWTDKSTLGCTCDMNTNMIHPGGTSFSNYIYETYDMYVTQTIEDWQVYGFVGAQVSDLDDVLFKDTKYNGDGSLKPTTAGKDKSGYYAVSTLPFGIRLWKTGVLYNGWTKAFDDDQGESVLAETLIGRDQFLAVLGEDSQYVEKRNGRIIFSGTDTSYGWDATDDCADDRCPVCTERAYCPYHWNLVDHIIVADDHCITNRPTGNLGDDAYDIHLIYDSEVLKNLYTDGQVHGDPTSYLRQAKNCRGITEHKSMWISQGANTHYSDASNEDCWAYRCDAGYVAKDKFYYGDIQASGAPSLTSRAAECYMVDGLNLWCRYNGYTDGNPSGTQYGYSAFCISDVFDVGYMENRFWMYESPDFTMQQMIIEHGYRIGNDLNIFNSDWTGKDQVHVYNHYSQYTSDQIKYSMMQCWIGDGTNPLAGAPRRHVDNVGTQIYKTGYRGEQINPKYASIGTTFESVTIMTLRGQFLRRDEMIGVFSTAGAGEGMPSYTGHGASNSEYGNGDRQGYYPQCYVRQGDLAQLVDPKEYKYGVAYMCYVTTSDNTEDWSHAGYWDTYPGDTGLPGYYGNEWNNPSLTQLYSKSKVISNEPLLVKSSLPNTNQWSNVLWNDIVWDSPAHFKYDNPAYEGNDGISEYGRLLKLTDHAGFDAWRGYNVLNMLDPETKGRQFTDGIEISFYPTDSAVMNSLYNGKYAYGVINNLHMWPYAPNGTYSDPVKVVAIYTPFATYNATKDVYPMIVWNNNVNGYEAKYTTTYTNEAGNSCTDTYSSGPNNGEYIGHVNDIVVHNPVSTEYSTVISNGMTGVSLSEIPGFVDESGQDMRYGESNIYIGGIAQNYENLSDRQKHDYWVIGNTCNIWVSDMGDFRSHSRDVTQNLYTPTTTLGIGSYVKGTLSKADGTIHINNNSLGPGYGFGSEAGMGKGYADAMLTSQWIYARYVKLPVAVTFTSGGTTYVVEKNTWINLNLCTPTSSGAVTEETSGLSFIYGTMDKNTNTYKQRLTTTTNGQVISKPLDIQVPGMINCSSYRNFYASGPYAGNVDKQFEYGLNFTFQILASAEECIDGTVEFFSMAVNDSVNYQKIANGEAITSDDVQLSVNALKYKEASNTSRTGSLKGKTNMGEFGRQEYHNGFMADSGAYKYAKIDIVGRIGNLALEDVADFRYSNLFKQATNDGSWLIEGVVRNTDPTKPNTIGAEGTDIYGNKVGTVMKATDGSTDIIVSHSVYNISRYTGIKKINSDADYANDHTGKLATTMWDSNGDGIAESRHWFNLPLTPKDNNLDEYKTQAVKLGYDAFFDIETIGNYYGNNGNNQGPSEWDTSRADYGDTRKQTMTIIPHYFLYDYTDATWEDDIKIWYGEMNNYTLCYDNGKTIKDMTSGLYQDVMKEGNRRNVSGLFDLISGNMYSEGGMTSIAMRLSAPTNNFGINALNSGTRWIGNSSRIVLDGYDRDFIGSWYLYQKTDGKGYDSTLNKKVLQTNPQWSNFINWGLADVDFTTQSQRWYFKIGLPSSAYITTSDYIDPDDHTVKNIIDGSGNVSQPGIVYSHEQLKEKHPYSVLICYLDITCVGEVYTLKYRGFHGEDVIEIFDPNTPDKPGTPPDDPSNPPGTPPWTPPGNELPPPKDPDDPPSPSDPPAEPPWPPVITYDPWDNSSTDLETYGTH